MPEEQEAFDHGAPIKETLASLGEAIQDSRARLASEHARLLEAVDYETRLAVTAQVMRAIVNHALEGGSFRHLIYDRLGFDLDAYLPLYTAGGMEISNGFDLPSPNLPDAAIGEDLLRAFGYGDGQPFPRTVTLEGGKEPWLTLCRARDAIMILAAQLAAAPIRDQRQRAQLEAHVAVRMEEALRAGVEMRKRQAAYFKTRNRDDLVASKEAEKRFDQLAAAALSTTPTEAKP